MTLKITEDMHIHSTFSDGKGTVEENLTQAVDVGLRRVTCVDHVRRDTAWLDEYVHHVRALRPHFALDIQVGIEAKILDETGTLDMPERIVGVDRIYVADHRLPYGQTCITPRQGRELMAAQIASPARLVRGVINGTRNAMLRHPKVTIAHLFSILPKLRLRESMVPDAWIAELARVARKRDAWLEIDERWRCPSHRVVNIFRAHGVPIVFSTDSHTPETIGEYKYAALIAGSWAMAPAAELVP